MPQELQLADLPDTMDVGVPFLVPSKETEKQEAFVLEKASTQDVGILDSGECFEVQSWFVVRKCVEQSCLPTTKEDAKSK